MRIGSVPLAAIRPKGSAVVDIVASDFVAYWKLNEYWGARADAIGSSHLADNATVGNAVGKQGNAAQFVATNSEFLSVADNPVLSMGDIDFTLVAWVYLDSLTSDRIFISTWNGTTGSEDMAYELNYRASTVKRFRLLVSPAADGTGAGIVMANSLGQPSINTWYLIVAWHDAVNDTLNIQINNGPVDSVAYALGCRDGASQLLIGKRPGGTLYMDGRIDEAGIAKKVLTAAKRTALYNNGTGRTLGNTVVVWPSGWCWFGNPRAVHYSGAQDQTYIGGVDKTGNLLVYVFNHTTLGTGYTNLHTALQDDDHANPALLIRNSDQKLLVFYSRHNGTTIYQRVSSSAEDVSAFEVEADLDASLLGSSYSYPNPIQLTGEANEPIYLFYRAANAAGGHSLWYSKSEDGGATWVAGTELFANGSGKRPYFQLVPNGNARIDIAITDAHPTEVATNSVYHFYYQGGKFYKSDGTEIVAALPLAPANVTKVYDGTSVLAWLQSIAIDGTGKPVIVYDTFPTQWTDHRYNYARWTGSAWECHEICAAGGYLYADEGAYSGGADLDHANVNTVYCAREVNGQFELFKYVTSDQGATWTGTAITSGSSAKNMRPVVPRNAHASLPVLWLNGTYTTYTDYDLNLRIS